MKTREEIRNSEEVKLEAAKQIEDRRKNRHPLLTDETDPYFVFRENVLNGNIDINYGDKYWLKENVFSKYTYVPKTHFTFDHEGNITGDVPKTGKVILKHNLSAYSYTIKILDVADVTKEALKDFVESSWESDIKNVYGWRGAEYFEMESIYFAEEYMPEVSKSGDYKLFTFKDAIWFASEDPNYESDLIKTSTYKENGEPTIHPASLITTNIDMSDDLKIKMEALVPIARKIYDEVGHFCRVDFYWVDGKPVLGEITLSPSWGLTIDARKFNKYNEIAKAMGMKQISSWEDFDTENIKEFIEMYNKSMSF